ncbi:MAG: galactose-1-phosphate uridylyltransferase, partial [Lachnospiraceae bacterium]|nr:galactose-1-phosphate uridylyltransferase [Lachnospiraceae bacterium]
MVYDGIKKLVQYGLETGLIEEGDRIYATNRILETLRLDEYEEPEQQYHDVDLEETLKELLDYACEQGITENSVGYRDLFDTKLMDCLMPRPTEVTAKFWKIY